MNVLSGPGSIALCVCLLKLLWASLSLFFMTWQLSTYFVECPLIGLFSERVLQRCSHCHGTWLSTCFITSDTNLNNLVQVSRAKLAFPSSTFYLESELLKPALNKRRGNINFHLLEEGIIYLLFGVFRFTSSFPNITFINMDSFYTLGCNHIFRMKKRDSKRCVCLTL